MEVTNEINGNITLNRMQPTNDQVTNKKLFEMYANLIKPLKSIENKMAACENLRYQGYLVRNKQDNEIVLFLLLAAALYIISVLVFAFLGTYIQEALLVQRGLLISFVIAIVGSLVICMLVYNCKDRKKQKRLSELESRFNEIRSEISSDIKILEPYLQYVPPAYRSSHALGFFVDSYVNVRVENLSEAVKSYDNYVHRQNMRQGFKQIDERLREISYMQKQSLASMHVGVHLGAMSLWL